MKTSDLPFSINHEKPYLPHELRPGKKQKQQNRDFVKIGKTPTKIYHHQSPWDKLKHGTGLVTVGFITQMPCKLPFEESSVNQDKIRQIEKSFAAAIEKQRSASLSLGFNSVKSLSREENRKKKRWMKEKSKFNAQTTMGLTFFDPAWQIDQDKFKKFIKSTQFKKLPSKYQKEIQDQSLSDYHRAKACYEGLLAAGEIELAKNLLLHEKETRCLYNYQGYREAIRVWDKTADQIEQLQNRSENAVYAHITDPDCQLKTKDKESVYDAFSKELEKTTTPPVLYTGGYHAADTDRPFYHHAVNLDMIVRRAISKYMPLGAYYPEPNLFVLIDKKKTHISGSFHDNSPSKSFESRRLANSIKQYGAQRKLVTKHSQFGSLSIATDLTRFKSDSTKKQSEKLDENWQHLFSKECLKALRGFSQSHLNPHDFGTNIGLSIPTAKLKEKPKGYRQTLTGIISQIMNKIDPISLILSGITSEFYETKYTSIQGIQFIKDYPRFIKECLHRAGLTKKSVDTTNFSEKQHLIIQTLAEKIESAVCDSTMYLDSKTKKEIISSIVDSSKEIHKYLDNIIKCHQAQ